MTTFALPASHVHVSEREIAHTWPDGRWDDAAWEDCTFCTAVELARLCHNAGIPATHVEAEALRADAGKAPTGGGNQDDVAIGVRKRYGWTVSPVSGFAALWAGLVPGHAASVQGSMGAFPAGHPLRRWDPPFDGSHDVTAIRLDDTDRVWWCDPLAPQGAYRGEWVSKADLAAYVDALTAAGGRHIIAPLVAPAPPAAYSVHVAKGSYNTYRIVAGRAVLALPLVTNGFAATCDLLTASQGDGTGTIALIRITSGGYGPGPSGPGRLLHRTAPGIVIHPPAPPV